MRLMLSRIASFNIDRIEDVKWNTSPFESLVLPDGYKDLILSFVESQLKDGDNFDDVINGKGKQCALGRGDYAKP